MVRRFLAAMILAAATAACSEEMAPPTTPTPTDTASTTTVAPAPAAAPAPAPEPAPAPTPAPVPAPAAPQTARYEVVFDSTWSGDTHPSDFPRSAHYSGLIGGTHNSSVSFWRDGGQASEGIRMMAERGSKSPLSTEVQDAIAAGTAEFVLSGGALNTSPGSISMEFDVSQKFPLVTLVTMVAPSPDWFAGVSALALFENNDWVASRTVTLWAYDAGTDSGVSYSSPDQATSPRAPISRLNGFPFSNNGTIAPLGTFTFRRLP
jgi:hypothetical protein